MKIKNFFDLLEDRIRNFLSLKPILYGVVGGVAIIIFWRGIWQTADLIHLNPVTSTIVSGVVLLVSGLRQEKKIAERSESEIKHELDYLREIKSDIADIKKKINNK